MSNYVYVTNSNDLTVTKIDKTAMTIAATLSLPSTPPYKIVIDAAEAFAYVTTEFGDLVQIDLSTFTVAQTVAVGGYGASQDLALDPTDTFCYVSAGGGFFGDAHKIDITGTLAVVGTLTTSGGGGANYTVGVAVDPYGDYVYIASKFTSSSVKIDKIDTATFTIVSTLTVPGMSAIYSVWGIKVDAAGAFAYVFADQLAKIDLSSFTLVSLDSSIGGIEDGMDYADQSGTAFLMLTQGNAENDVTADLFIWPPGYSATYTSPEDSRQIAIDWSPGGYAYSMGWGTYSGISTISKIDIGLSTVIATCVTGTVSNNRGIAVHGHAAPLVAENEIVMLV